MSNIHNLPPGGNIQPNSSSQNTETKNLKDFAENVPKNLPAKKPFLGVVALKSGNSSIVHAAHCPEGAAFTSGQVFNGLSTGKLPTAVSVLKMIQDGVLVKGKPISLDTPLSDLLEANEFNVPLREPYAKAKPNQETLAEFKKHAGDITLKHLLSHTAGFITLPPEGDLPEREVWSEKAFVDQKALKVGGYSNYGYQLLAVIIGKYSPHGKNKTPEEGFRCHIKEEVFKKAEMTSAISELDKLPPVTDSGEYTDFVEPTDLKRYEVKEEDGTTKEVDGVQGYPHGNGCFRMNADDLVKFADAMNHNTLIREDTFKKMLTNNPPLGFKIIKDRQTGIPKGWAHPGHDTGQSADLSSWYGKREGDPPVITAALSNYSDGADSAHELFERKFGR